MDKKGLEKQNKKLNLQLAKEKAKAALSNVNLQLAKEKTKASLTNIKKEFKKSVLTALVAAFGFLIALSWKELITEYVNQLSSVTPVQGRLVEAFIVTLISVVGILIVTKLFSEK